MMLSNARECTGALSPPGRHAGMAAVLVPGGIIPSWCPPAPSITSAIALRLAFWSSGLLLVIIPPPWAELGMAQPWAPVLPAPTGADSPAFISHSREGPLQPAAPAPPGRSGQNDGSSSRMGWRRLRLTLKDPGRGRATMPKDPAFTVPQAADPGQAPGAAGQAGLCCPWPPQGDRRAPLPSHRRQ